jgi:hypothetical protein
VNWRLGLELLALTLAAASAAALIPLSTGFMAWSWDALNHHIYLGLIAQEPRWHLDVLAASNQSYQYPYLYWPVYRLSLLNGSGASVGALWSGVQAALLMPPVWLICRQLLPSHKPSWQGVFERCLACYIAFASGLVLTALETTSNDILAAVPLLWALALGFNAKDSPRRSFAVAALWGISVAFKLSNAMFLPMMAVFWWMPNRPHWPLRRAAMLASGAALGFTLAYLPWGWQLWEQTSNPFYPYLTEVFSPRN